MIIRINTIKNILFPFFPTQYLNVNNVKNFNNMVLSYYTEIKPQLDLFIGHFLL